MNKRPILPRLKACRFPREVIACAVWACHRFALSVAEVEDLLAERDVIVGGQAIRLWVNRVGAQVARRIRRDRPGAADKRRIDAVVIAINGVNHRLWRAVGANGDAPDILVQPRHTAQAAERFLKRLMARLSDPRGVVADTLRSAIKPVRDLTPNADHRAHKALNNRIEGSHRPTRKREKIMGRFKPLRQAQRLLSAHDRINGVFRPRRHRLSATSWRHARADALRLRDDDAAELTA